MKYIPTADNDKDPPRIITGDIKIIFIPIYDKQNL